MTKKTYDEYDTYTQTKRIADAMEEILRLVKQDQEKFERYKEETTEKWEPGLCK
jgi:hypothetical protein